MKEGRNSAGAGRIQIRLQGSNSPHFERRRQNSGQPFVGQKGGQGKGGGGRSHVERGKVKFIRASMAPGSGKRKLECTVKRSLIGRKRKPKFRKVAQGEDTYLAAGKSSKVGNQSQERWGLPKILQGKETEKKKTVCMER